MCSNCDATLGFGVFHRAIEGVIGTRTSRVPLFLLTDGLRRVAAGVWKTFVQMSDCQMFSCQNCRTSSCRECVSFDVRVTSAWMVYATTVERSTTVNSVLMGGIGVMIARRSACEDCLDSCPDCDHTWCLECSHIMRCERCDKKACDRCESGD